MSKDTGLECSFRMERKYAGRAEAIIILKSIHGEHAIQLIIQLLQVDFSCEGDFRKLNLGPSTCILGDFQPTKPGCFHPSNLSHNKQDGSDGKGKRPDTDMFLGVKRACGTPPKERGAVSFVEGRPIERTDYRYVWVKATEVP
jgi:hypothetical protein